MSECSQPVSFHILGHRQIFSSIKRLYLLLVLHSKLVTKFKVILKKFNSPFLVLSYSFPTYMVMLHTLYLLWPGWLYYFAFGCAVFYYTHCAFGNLDKTTNQWSKIVFVLYLSDTVKPVYKDHPWDPKIVAVVDRWSLFRGNLCNESPNWDLKIVVVIDRWSILWSGR